MNYYNTLDVLANRYPEVELPNVPPHQVLEADRGADFATITRNHLALLDQNDAIKARFLSEPDWLNLYGLPIRYEEREVNGHPQGLQMLRAQRTVFVIWNVPAPGTTVGRVNLQNVPDKVKRLNNVIIPDGAKAPVLADEAAELPVFTVQPPVVLSPPTSDREALVRLYHATDGPNWRNTHNWLSLAPLDEWHGVTTDHQGRITELRLPNNLLRRSIPPQLGRLSRLQVLDLGSNELSGAIPPELGDLPDLVWLTLPNNRLDGLIPPELGSLSRLQGLNLASNQLGGSIPHELGRLPSLQVLILGSNQLGGAIPPALAGLTNLEWLALGRNQLTGTIPAALAALGNLRSLDLHSNRLNGEIPPALGWLANLQALLLYGNRLTGAIPAELGNLANLESLGLHGNQLTGTIPPELSNLLKLDWLFLAGGNQFSGCIPLSLREVTQHDLANLSLPLCGHPVQGPTGAPQPMSQRDVLIALYHATDGANWANNEQLADRQSPRHLARRQRQPHPGHRAAAPQQWADRGAAARVRPARRLAGAGLRGQRVARANPPGAGSPPQPKSPESRG